MKVYVVMVTFCQPGDGRFSVCSERVYTKQTDADILAAELTADEHNLSAWVEPQDLDQG